MRGMTDRDTFAAAALTGLLASDNYTRTTTSAEHAAVAYELADAMLRERERTNHDAAPAARACTDADRGRADKADSRPGEGTGDTQEPVAWGVMRVGGRWVSILDNAVQAETSRQSFDRMENWVHEVVPLYRQPALTDAEREAIDTAEASLMRESTDPHTPLPVRQRLGSAAAVLRGLLERLGLEK